MTAPTTRKDLMIVNMGPRAPINARRRHYWESEAINWGLSGPILLSFEIEWDLRKVDHYESYEEFDWQVQCSERGFISSLFITIGEMRIHKDYSTGSGMNSKRATKI
ncbi:hypothetical protein H5410_054716 [Solanum commersonii]|uniref:NADH-quinone oxidoreductase subunit D domain-containing protein n=1 Tax=Solanum commersonii TaxID=4109 RepID=A0A9J5WIA4_SOLCO|nr:hypothetical protein H5410_054716 [Solanum commersonii]